MTTNHEQKTVSIDPKVKEDLKNALVTPLLETPLENFQISEITVQIVKKICEEKNSELIDFSAARRLEDWSSLSHQVVGYESN